MVVRSLTCPDFSPKRASRILDAVDAKKQVAQTITSVARPHRELGWETTSVAARLRGTAGQTVQAYFQHKKWPGDTLTFWSGAYNPRLRELLGFSPHTGKTPHHDYWCSAATLVYRLPIVIEKLPAAEPLDLAQWLRLEPPARVTTSVHMSWDQLTPWFEQAFEQLRPALAHLTTDEGVYEWLKADVAADPSNDHKVYTLREAALLGAALGRDQDLPEMVEAARRKIDRLDIAFKDRSKHPMDWSHDRFLRQLEQAKS